MIIERTPQPNLNINSNVSDINIGSLTLLHTKVIWRFYKIYYSHVGADLLKLEMF